MSSIPQTQIRFVDPDGAPAQSHVAPIDIAQAADEAIQLLVEKLAESDAKNVNLQQQLAAAQARAEAHLSAWHADHNRLRWLHDRLQVCSTHISNAIFGNSSWMDLREAIDTAIAEGR